MVSTRSAISNGIKEESLEIPTIKSSLKIFRRSKSKPIKNQNHQQVQKSGDTKIIQKEDIIDSSKYKIGHGGFANCYRAKSKVFVRKQLVLKELMEGSKTSSENLEFIHHTKMNHVNIVRAHAYYDTNSIPVLVLDFCEKGDLHDYLTGQGFPRTFPRSHMYIRMIADGINYIHRKCSLIHMDIKCENILVSGLDIAKICDFGSIIEMKKDGYRDMHTKHNGYTKLYVPREFLKDKEFDSTADVWALAVIAFELIFECHPFFPECSCEFNSASKSCEHDEVALSYMDEALEDEDKNFGKFASFDKDVKKEFENQGFEMKYFFNKIFGVPRIERPISSDVLKLPFIKWK